MPESIYTSLAAHWKADEASPNASMIDAIGTAVLTDHGSPAATTGLINGARGFNGTDQYFDRADEPLFDFTTGDWSFHLWVYFNAFTADQCVLTKGTTGLSISPEARILVTSAGSVECNVANGMSAEELTIGTVSTDAWHRLYFEYDSTAQRVRGRLDQGSTIESAGTITPYHTAADFVLGRINGVAGRYLDGKIDEVSLRKGAGSLLSDAELAFLYNQRQGRTIEQIENYIPGCASCKQSLSISTGISL